MIFVLIFMMFSYPYYMFMIIEYDLCLSVTLHTQYIPHTNHILFFAMHPIMM